MVSKLLTDGAFVALFRCKYDHVVECVFLFQNI